MLTDEVIIKITAGKGGAGSISFRHEKYIPKGGPDGGDGGDGGNIILKVDKDINTLTHFDTQKDFQAENGHPGMGVKKTGKDAQDLILKVARGTIIYEKDSQGEFRKIADLTEAGQSLIVARGGKGGWGNVHFATSTDQAPRKANPGTKGQTKVLKLELRLIADVGLIGLPNSGKSTLLARITRAKPKIANYPFTTLEPNLGIATVGNYSFTVADIPGLIKGAAEGRGLGFRFLRHVRRTRVLVHLIDCQSQDILKDYQEIRQELGKFSPILLRKPEIVVISKVDTMDERAQRKLYAKVAQLKPIFISSASGSGIQDLLYEIKKRLR